MYKNEKSFAREMTEAFAKKLPGTRAVIFEQTDSTNTQAKLAAADSAGRDAFFIARSQTGGRGRMGRSFLSERGGLYISYLSHPTLAVADAVKLTAYAAVCLCETLSELTSLSPGIKWVNDCLVRGKKIAGILTEGGFSADGASFDYTVVGIGLNVAAVDFGEELSEIATDVESECGVLPDLSELAVTLAAKLMKFSSADADEYMKKYRELSVVVGRRVKIICSAGDYFAAVDDIDKDGALLVSLDSGEKKRIISGEISLRLTDAQ